MLISVSFCLKCFRRDIASDKSDFVRYQGEVAAAAAAVGGRAPGRPASVHHAG